MNEIVPNILCERGQNIVAAAAAHGFAPPRFRVGPVPENLPRDGESLIARVKVQHWERGFPVFQLLEEGDNSEG